MENGDINFYDVNTTDLTDHNVTEIHNGHQYVYDKDLDTDDTITFRCTACDAVKIEKKITLDELYWKTVRQPVILIIGVGMDGNRKQEQR